MIKGVDAGLMGWDYTNIHYYSHIARSVDEDTRPILRIHQTSLRATLPDTSTRAPSKATPPAYPVPVAGLIRVGSTHPSIHFIHRLLPYIVPFD